VHLLGVVVELHALAQRRRRRAGDAPVAGGQIGERRRHLGHDVVVVDITGHRHGRGLAGVVGGEELANVGGGERAHRVALASGVATEAVSGEQLLREGAQGDIVRGVVVHGQLFEDHLAFAVDVAVGQRRVREHIAEQLDPGVGVTGRHPAVVRRVLLGGEGVDIAPHAVDGAGDAARRAGRRALEQQVLEEVADARLVGGLVTRADLDPRAHRHRPRPWDVVGGDGEAARELGDRVSHDGRASRACGRATT